MDKNLLRYFMAKNGDRQKDLAEVLGIPQSALCERMNQRRSFRQEEMNTIRKRYKLSAEDMMSIFFTA